MAWKTQVFENMVTYKFLKIRIWINASVNSGNHTWWIALYNAIKFKLSG